MNDSLFITGTDTGVGKTLITGFLGRFLTENGMNVISQKWVQTGCAGVSEDINTHLKLMGKTIEDVQNYLPEISPYVLEYPSSPHLAAELEKVQIEEGLIEESFLRLARDFDVVLVEGVGGVLVPVNRKALMIDIAKALDLPVLVVAENRLGAINQTMMTIDVLRVRGLHILGIVFNQVSGGEDEIILKDNPKIVQKLTGIEVLGELPYSKDTDALYGEFPKTAHKIFGRIKLKA